MSQSETEQEFQEFSARFTRDKITTNTYRFQEETEGGQPPRVGTLYIQKWACSTEEPPEEVEAVIRIPQE